MIKVRLKTMWMIDREFESNVPEKYMISHGLWITNGLEVINSDLNVFTLVCISSNHKDISIGDIRRLPEIQLISMCHEVKLVYLPKLIIE